MSSHALTKNIGPAATSLKNASMANLQDAAVQLSLAAPAEFWLGLKVP